MLMYCQDSLNTLTRPPDEYQGDLSSGKMGTRVPACMQTADLIVIDCNWLMTIRDRPGYSGSICLFESQYPTKLSSVESNLKMCTAKCLHNSYTNPKQFTCIDHQMLVLDRMTPAVDIECILWGGTTEIAICPQV